MLHITNTIHTASQLHSSFICSNDINANEDLHGATAKVCKDIKISPATVIMSLSQQQVSKHKLNMSAHISPGNVITVILFCCDRATTCRSHEAIPSHAQ